MFVPQQKPKARKAISITQGGPSDKGFKRGYQSFVQDSRTPHDALSDMTNVTLDQDNLPRPRESLILFGQQPLGTLIGAATFIKIVAGLPQKWDISMQVIAGVGKVHVRKDGATWVAATGVNTYNSTAVVNFAQSGNRVYVSNGSNAMSYYNILTGATVEYTALTTPSTPTATGTGLTGTNYTYYYRVTANNAVGESTASVADTEAVSTVRDSWTPATQYITTTWSAVSGATSYNLYAGTVAGAEQFLTSTTGLTFKDDGTLTLNAFKLAPAGNSTLGPVLKYMWNTDGQLFGVGDTTNPDYLWYDAGATAVGDFSPFNGGGNVGINSGGDTVPESVRTFRTGKGDPAVTVLSSGVAGCFAKGTLVLTDKGYRPIESIKEGDVVASFDGEQVSHNLVEVSIGVDDQPKPMIEFTYDNDTITATYDHPFYNGEKYYPLYQLAWGKMETSQRVQLKLLCEQYGEAFDYEVSRGVTHRDTQTWERQVWSSKNSDEPKNSQGTSGGSSDLDTEPQQSTIHQPQRLQSKEQRYREPGMVYPSPQQPTRLSEQSDGRFTSQSSGKDSQIRQDGVEGDSELVGHTYSFSTSKGQSGTTSSIHRITEEISPHKQQNPEGYTTKTGNISGIKVKKAETYYALSIANVHTYIVGLSQLPVHNTGKMHHVVFTTTTFSNNVITIPNVQEANGQGGTVSARSVLEINNSLVYPTGQDFKSTGTQANIQNILSTNSVSNDIVDDVRQLNLSAMGNSCGLLYEGKAYWALPVGDTSNNQIWVKDYTRGGIWIMPWIIPAQYMWLSENNVTGKVDFCIYNGTNILSFSRSVYTQDNGVAFRTRVSHGGLVWSESGMTMGAIQEQRFKLLQPRGTVQINGFGLNEDGQVDTLASDSFTQSSSFTGWGQLMWSDGALPSLWSGDVGIIDFTTSQVHVTSLEIDETLNQLGWEVITDTIDCDYYLSTVYTRGVEIPNSFYGD